MKSLSQTASKLFNDTPAKPSSWRKNSRSIPKACPAKAPLPKGKTLMRCS
jgi:hypothetical protein